jgi:hypothetical protein
MADASAQLCRAYLTTAAAAGQGGVRELAAGRMHLKGLLKQCEAFEEAQEYRGLQGLLQEVVEAEDAAVAAKKQLQAA